MIILVLFMGTWLLSPLTLIYALILIAYGFKIVLAGSLPKGEIAQLTTPFLIIGTLTWLLLSIPAAILLAISIAVRIDEYGFTTERIALLIYARAHCLAHGRDMVIRTGRLVYLRAKT